MDLNHTTGIECYFLVVQQAYKKMETYSHLRDRSYYN